MQFSSKYAQFSQNKKNPQKKIVYLAVGTLGKYQTNYSWFRDDGSRCKMLAAEAKNVKYTNRKKNTKAA